MKQIISNPLNALKVYAPFKRLQSYYALHVHKNIVHDIKMSLGRMMLESLFECDVLLPKCQFGTREEKLEATKEFLHRFAFLLSGTEFLITNGNLGVSVRQGTEMVMLIKEVQQQMGGFHRYLCRQQSEPTGEGSEQV